MSSKTFMFDKVLKIGLICMDSVSMAALGEVLFLMLSMVLCSCVFFSRMLVFSGLGVTTLLDILKLNLIVFVLLTTKEF